MGLMLGKKSVGGATLPLPTPRYRHSLTALFFLQLHGLIVACCLDIALDPTLFTVACFCHQKFHCTIIALANEHIAFLDFHSYHLPSLELEGFPLYDFPKKKP